MKVTSPPDYSVIREIEQLVQIDDQLELEPELDNEPLIRNLIAAWKQLTKSEFHFTLATVRRGNLQYFKIIRHS